MGSIYSGLFLSLLRAFNARQLNIILEGGTLLTETRAVEADAFYGELKGDGLELRDLLWPLADLSPRERAVFVEYHYWRTHMKTIATSHRISLARVTCPT